MTLERQFPRWRQLSVAPGVPWGEPCDLADDATFYLILGLIAHEQSFCSINHPQTFWALCEAMAADVLALQDALPPGCKPINLEYLQFEISLVPVRLTVNRGDFGRAHDWILNGFSDSVGHAVQRVFFADRPNAFLRSKIPWIAGNRTSSLIDWLFAFYYYCWRRAALFETAVSVFNGAVEVIDDLPVADERAIDARRMMLNWAAGHDHPAAPTLASILEMIFAAPEVTEKSRAGIAVLFATQVGRFTSRRPQDWAAWALTSGAHHLSGHEPFQLLLTLVETQADWDRLKPEILNACERYAAALRRDIPASTSFTEAADQRSGLLNAAFFVLYRFGHSGDFLEVLSRWYGISDQVRLRGGVLFVCPNHANGTVYLGANALSIDHEGTPQLASLTNITNRALGLTLTVQGDRVDPAVPDRPGQPAYEEGQEFARVLETAYRFAQLDVRTLAGATSLVSFPAYPHPLQAMMSASLDGVSLPIASSLEEPQPDRIVRRALLWSADNDFTSRFEIDAVNAVLTSSDILCEVVSGTGRTPQDFYEAYSDPNYDLIWIAGHGSYNHWAPGSAQLHAGDSCAVGIEDLRRLQPQTGGRRLLVLNICDGGVSAVLGGIHKLGLAPMLAGHSQATVSHIWPVEPRVASAFGVLLAHGIRTNRTFFAAFQQALRALRAPWTTIVEQVNEFAPGTELGGRLTNSDQDTANIFHWGSPCFFQ